MFRRILLTLSLTTTLAGCFDREIQERKEYETARYARWTDLAEALCVTPPPKDPRQFEVWLDGKAIAGEAEGDRLRRELNGEPACHEERYNYVNGVPTPRSEPPARYR